MDDISEKTAQQTSGSDEEIIDLVEEVSDTTAEDNEEFIELTEAMEEAPEDDEEFIELTKAVEEAPEYDEEFIELTEAVEEAPAEAVALVIEGQEEDPDLGVEYEDAGATDLLADLSMELETESESNEARIDPDPKIIASQFSKEELETLLTRAATNAISEIAERVVTEVAEKAVSKEIEKIKSALK